MRCQKARSGLGPAAGRLKGRMNMKSWKTQVSLAALVLVLILVRLPASAARDALQGLPAFAPAESVIYCDGDASAEPAAWSDAAGRANQAFASLEDQMHDEIVRIYGFDPILKPLEKDLAAYAVAVRSWNPDPAGFTMDAVFVLKLRFLPVAEAAPERIVSQFQQIKGLPHGVHYKQDTYRDWKLWVPDLAGYPLVAQRELYVLEAGSRASLLAAIHCQAGEKPGLASNADFGRLRTEFPADGRLFIYVNAGQMSRELLKRQAAQAGTTPASKDGVDEVLSPADLEHAQEALKAFKTVGGWISLDQSRVVIEGRILVDQAAAPEYMKKVFSTQGVDVRPDLQRLPAGSVVVLATNLGPFFDSMKTVLNQAGKEESTPGDSSAQPATTEPATTDSVTTEPAATSAQPDESGPGGDSQVRDMVVKFLDVFTGKVDLALQDLDFVPGMVEQLKAYKACQGCEENLNSLSTALSEYARAHEGSLPDSLERLVPDGLAALPTCPAGGWYDYRRLADGESFSIECVRDAHTAIGVIGRLPAYDSINGLNPASLDITGLDFWKQIKAFGVLEITGRDALMGALGPIGEMLQSTGASEYHGASIYQVPVVPVQLAITDQDVILSPAAQVVLEAFLDQWGKGSGYAADPGFQTFSSNLEGRWLFYLGVNVQAFRPWLDTLREKAADLDLDQALPAEAKDLPGTGLLSKQATRAALEQFFSALKQVGMVRVAGGVDENGGRFRIEVTR